MAGRQGQLSNFPSRVMNACFPPSAAPTAVGKFTPAAQVATIIPAPAVPRPIYRRTALLRGGDGGVATASEKPDVAPEASVAVPETRGPRKMPPDLPIVKLPSAAATVSPSNHRPWPSGSEKISTTQWAHVDPLTESRLIREITGGAGGCVVKSRMPAVVLAKIEFRRIRFRDPSVDWMPISFAVIVLR